MMRLPPPLGPRSRLVHAGMAVAAAVNRFRLGGPVPPDRVRPGEPVDVDVPGRGRLRAWTWGPAGGVPLVLVHGLDANAQFFTGTASLLGQSRRVIALDLRGHGSTGPLPGGYALEETRADLVGGLDALGLDAVDLAGHSWGGKVVLDLMAVHPTRVRRLALIDPVPPSGLAWLIRRSGWITAAVFSPERGPFPSAAALAQAHRVVSWLRHAEPWMHAAFDASFREQPDGSWHHVLPEDGLREIYEVVLQRPSPLPLDAVRMPVRLLPATFSVVPPAARRALRGALPQLTVQCVNGEHSLHATNPVGLARALAEFFSPIE